MSGTIFALSSGRLPSGVAVVRVTGAWAHSAARALAGDLPSPRQVVLRNFIDPASGNILDRGLLLLFTAPSSTTGEDMAEFHLHGGPAVVSAVLAALAGVPELRPAEPGEFTRRAFLNGKMDLAQVEGLADLIDARTEAQRVQALAQMDGRLSRLYEDWRQRLIRALAHVEADIDFADGEDDVPAGIGQTVLTAVDALQQAIAAHLNDSHRGERLRDGLALAIIGPPNAGKSSLLNWLARRDAAIVSATPGTTRDLIEVHLDLGGYPVTVIDTAGLRETGDEIEAEGVRRARARAASADLTLYLQAAGTVADEVPPGALHVINKSDLADPAGAGAFHISVARGDGLAGLLAHLTSWAVEAAAPGDAPALTRARHRAALERAQGHLIAATGQTDLVLVAEELRLAARALASLTGRIDVEDLLEVIFRDFCIGK